MDNRVLDLDSYKASHHLQYEKGTTLVHSYLEARGSENPEWKETVFFGLQYILKRYFSTPITLEEVLEANEILTAHGEPFPLEQWKRLIEKHGGHLPLRIRAVREGTVVPLKNVLMTVQNTDDEFFWLTSWFETAFMRLWYPITVATLSYQVKKDIYSFLKETADDPDAEIPFKLHDFGSRGVSSQESAGIGGLAHLVNFLGTDTVQALQVGRKFYNCVMAGYSIPAAEHSTITSWGMCHEVDAYRNMLKNFAAPGKILAVVSDSWDIYNAAENIWGGELRQEVIDSGATVVIRPDSGDPVEVCLKLAGILADKFGYEVNTKGYKVLKYVRIIQGDGCNPESIHNIMVALKDAGFSISNIAFGMGGGLLQKVNRDTFKFAYKCSAIICNGQMRAVYKDPVTDAGKVSKRGFQELVNVDGRLVSTTVFYHDAIAVGTALVTYFENGKILVDDNMEEIRFRAKVK